MLHKLIIRWAFAITDTMLIVALLLFVGEMPALAEAVFKMPLLILLVALVACMSMTSYNE